MCPDCANLTPQFCWQADYLNHQKKCGSRQCIRTLQDWNGPVPSSCLSKWEQTTQKLPWLPFLHIQYQDKNIQKVEWAGESEMSALAGTQGSSSEKRKVAHIELLPGISWTSEPCLIDKRQWVRDVLKQGKLPMFKISLKTNDRLGDVAQLLEYLLSMHKTLGLTANST